MYFSDSLKCIHLILICGGGGGGRAFVPVDRMRKCRSSSFIPSCSLTFLYCICFIFLLYLCCICFVFLLCCMRNWISSSFIPSSLTSLVSRLYLFFICVALYLCCIWFVFVLYSYCICVVFVLYCTRKWRTSSLTFLPTLQFLPRVNDPRNLVSLLKKYGFEKTSQYLITIVQFNQRK